jgi:plastocyanin
MTSTAHIRLVGVRVAIVALLLCSMGHVSAAPKPATHTVTIEGAQFQPGVLAVRAGDSIVWVNKDPFPHTVTSQAGRFDSRQIEPDKSWTYRTAKKGDFAYVCSLHQTMKATLRVR